MLVGEIEGIRPALARGLTTAEVAEQLEVPMQPSSLARMDGTRLESVADLIRRSRGELFKRSKWADPLFWNVEASDEDRSQYFAVGNAINFRFWNRIGGEVLPSVGVIKGMEFRGAMYMWRCLRRAVDEGRPILAADFLAELSTETFSEIFGDDEGLNPLAPSGEDRVANLRDLGSRLQSDWGGKFYRVAQASKGSIVRFASMCRSFRAFDDPLFKLTMVNAILHSGSGVYAFHDELLPGIDYQILKQLLRQGVLLPSAGVGEKLRRGILLGAAEGLELRRLALMAMVEISRLTGLDGEVLDNYYWLNRTVCTDPVPRCVDPELAHECPFLEACSRFVNIGRPLELTRYY
jgi:hypothetical protein